MPLQRLTFRSNNFGQQFLLFSHLLAIVLFHSLVLPCPSFCQSSCAFFHHLPQFEQLKVPAEPQPGVRKNTQIPHGNESKSISFTKNSSKPGPFHLPTKKPDLLHSGNGGILADSSKHTVGAKHSLQNPNDSQLLSKIR